MDAPAHADTRTSEYVENGMKHALGWTNYRGSTGKTGSGLGMRALERLGGFPAVFVRDGDLNRVVVAAGLRSQLDAGGKLSLWGAPARRELRAVPVASRRSLRSVDVSMDRPVACNLLFTPHTTHTKECSYD